MSTFLLSFAIIMLIAGLFSLIWTCAMFASSMQKDHFDSEMVIRILGIVFSLSIAAIIFGIIGIVFLRT